MVDYFVRGGFFMWPILGCLILGLMLSFERFWTLTRANINSRKFTKNIAEALGGESGVQKAAEIAAQTRGPIANVVEAGLSRFSRGLDAVEKAIMTAGTIEMAFLERNLVWLSTVISVAPMLGFLGTVQGMVGAFDAIAKANDVSPALVADNIAIALLTTLFGLVVAIIIQIFQNYFISRIDKIVVDMEESTQEILEQLIIKNKLQ